jgi:ornithine decarboxylase
VAEAGAIDAEVLLVTERPESTPRRWAFLDIGVYNGLGEVVGEAIRYHVRSSRAGRLVPTVLAGPTCDSTDVIYRRTPCYLPDDLGAGDHLHLLATGAYTSAYATAGFNGMPAITVHYLPET